MKPNKTEEPPSETHKTIEYLRGTLNGLTTDWVVDGCSPSNYVKKTGTGEVVAMVNRWCGGFQNPGDPITIGHRAEICNGCGKDVREGVVLVSDHASIEEAIEVAKNFADRDLAFIREDRNI